MYGANIYGTETYSGFNTPLVPLSGVNVFIAQTKRTDQIDWRSFRLTQILTNQVDTLTFTIKRFGTKTFKPDLLDSIEVFENTKKIFGGQIIKIRERIDGRVEFIEVICKDHTHEMDRFLVASIIPISFRLSKSSRNVVITVRVIATTKLNA